ncbi:MAG: hypothetical protein ACI81P_002691 [Neolewinella sp.]|jgi:hypothetical protein
MSQNTKTDTVREKLKVYYYRDPATASPEVSKY